MSILSRKPWPYSIKKNWELHESMDDLPQMLSYREAVMAYLMALIKMIWMHWSIRLKQKTKAEFELAIKDLLPAWNRYCRTMCQRKISMT